MELILQSQLIEDVVLLRCRGRIVSGAEIAFLQAELQKLTQFRKRVVLQLAETNYIDSAGLGALVRLFGVLRAAGGDLKLCQVSPFLLQVLQVSNLLSLFRTYASEEEAIEAFSEGTRSSEEAPGPSKTRIVCIDTSSDLLAYVNALLKRSGYDVFTTRHSYDATTLVGATKARLVICGPGMRTNMPAIERFRQLDPNLKLLLLEPDFSTTEAGQAGVDLVNRVQSLLMA